MGTPLHKEQHNKYCTWRERGNKREKQCVTLGFFLFFFFSSAHAAQCTTCCGVTIAVCELELMDGVWNFAETPLRLWTCRGGGNTCDHMHYQVKIIAWTQPMIRHIFSRYHKSQFRKKKKNKCKQSQQTPRRLCRAQFHSIVLIINTPASPSFLRRGSHKTNRTSWKRES